MSEATAALSGPAEAGTGDAGNSGAAGAAPSAPAWAEGLSEDNIAYINQRGWENPHQLFESYRNLEKLQSGSKNVVEIPGVDATDEQMGSFYDALGRPGSPGEYGLELPDGGDQTLMDWFSETAHRHGLSQKQTQSLFNEWNEMSGQRMENMMHEQKVANEAEIDNLKKEWGADYDKMINAGRLAAQGLGLGEEQLSAMEDKLGTAEMLKHFALLGSKMGEPDFVDGKTGDGFGASPAQAQAEIAELKTDKAFMDAYLSGDKAAVSKMQRLMDKAYG